MVHGRITVAASLAFVFGVSVAHATSTAEAVPGEYLVKVKDAALFKSAMNAERASVQSTRVVLKDQNVYLVKRNILENRDFAIQSLKSENTEIVEPNYIYRVNKIPNDPTFSELWGMKNDGQNSGRPGIDIGATQAWDIETGNKNVVVAIIDTGIDYTHEDLKDNMWTNAAELNGVAGVDDDKNGFVDDIYGYDFANDKGDPMDDFGHGTHCAGTIGAKGNNGVGVAGVNWDVRMMAVKFLDSSGGGTLEGAVKAIDYATNMGAMIESNSWGGKGESDLIKQAIERARDKNVLFVAAAGNDGTNNDTDPSYPASYATENIIAVAAIGNDGSTTFKLDDGTQWGTNFGKTTVHLAAPGDKIKSTVPKANGYADIIDPSGYRNLSGTSMATPHVSGIAALLKAHEPALNYSQLKARILASAVPYAPLRNLTITGGVANAYYALANTTPPPDPQDPANWPVVKKVVSSPHPYALTTTTDYKVQVSGAKALSILFDRFELETNYDTVQFKDSTGNVVGTWSGVHNGEYSPTVAGDTITMTITTDNTVNEYGFDITKVAVQK
jgi:thermitase